MFSAAEYVPGAATRTLKFAMDAYRTVVNCSSRRSIQRIVPAYKYYAVSDGSLDSVLVVKKMYGRCSSSKIIRYCYWFVRVICVSISKTSLFKNHSALIGGSVFAKGNPETFIGSFILNDAMKF